MLIAYGFTLPMQALTALVASAASGRYCWNNKYAKDPVVVPFITIDCRDPENPSGCWPRNLTDEIFCVKPETEPSTGNTVNPLPPTDDAD